MNFKLNIQLFGNAVIPYNEGRNGKRSIDGLWEQEFNVAKALTAAIGCEFGSVLNIQDAGQKEQGKVYLDKNNGKLYKCLNTTTSVSNTTENFALFNVQQNSDRLDNLIKIYFKSTSEFKGMVVKMTIAYASFKPGESRLDIPYSELGLAGKRIYGLFTTCNSADGTIAPEAQAYNTEYGIKVALHDDSGVYSIRYGAGYYVLIFHEAN